MIERFSILFISHELTQTNNNLGNCDNRIHKAEFPIINILKLKKNNKVIFFAVHSFQSFGFINFATKINDLIIFLDYKIHQNSPCFKNKNG